MRACPTGSSHYGSGGTVQVKPTIHGDHWFFTNVTQGAELTERRAQWIVDSDLDRAGKNMLSFYPLAMPEVAVPRTMVKAFRLEAEVDGAWQTLCRRENNYQRLVRVPAAATAAAVRLVPESTWGATAATVFAFEAR